MDNLGQCTWQYALVDGVKTDIVDAIQGVKGLCPVCGGVLVPRKGEIRNWHWWHINGRNCDQWYEPKGLWHRSWQYCFPKSWREVPLEQEFCGEKKKHIADIFTPDGWTVEFQYSHLSMRKIEERERFYVNLVWLVSGTRLEIDKRNASNLVARFQNFPPHETAYVALSPELIKVNCSWRNRNKLVFFDFEGEFDKSVLAKDLYCLLPGCVMGARIVLRVAVDVFLKGISRNNVSVFIDELLRYKAIYENEVKKREEKQRKAMELEIFLEKERKRIRLENEIAEELANPARYAISLGWLDAWWLSEGSGNRYAVDFDLEAIPLEGKIALHYRAGYSEDDYKRDKNHYFREHVLLRVPEYSHLRKLMGAIVGIFDYSVEEMQGNRILIFKSYKRLMDCHEHNRPVRGVEDQKGIWTLNEKLLQVVNDRRIKPPAIPRPRPPETQSNENKVKNLSQQEFVYTGKGNLYRNARTHWLHIFHNGIYVPLKRENQTWDLTYDAKFGTRRPHL